MGDLRIKFDRLQRRSLFLVARWLVRRAGFDGVRPLGAALGRVHHALSGRTRRACLAGIAALRGTTPDDPAVRAILREAYRVNTIAVLEVLSMVDQQLDAARLAARCRVDGLHHLQAARQGRGAILLATHSGNSLLLAAQLADAGWPVTVVYRHARMMSAQFFAGGLPCYGIDGILANEGFKAYARMVDALRKNRIVFAMVDQGVRDAETGVPIRFLGKDMPMPGGVVQLARSSRAPMLPVTALAADPVWHFAIEPPLVLPPGGSIEEDTVRVMQHVEAQVLAHPQLWSWQHRRWRHHPLPGRA
ncbi:MAG: lysophospholipid acyltransferase family protein [Pseudomonadota bacterium]|nr:lysophospholipid acyltransferase family protein [Pseudomonadota bacterium]